VDEAAALGADTLVLVCGPAADRDLAAGRDQVTDAICQLAPYAASSGVSLAIEPMHPLYCADRSVVVTLAQALDIAMRTESDVVGLAVDSYHVWWDPELDCSLARAAGRVWAFQVADWLAPLPDHLNGRGMLGDGSIELRRMRRLVDAGGYDGPVEVEIFNVDVWAADPQDTVRLVAERYQVHVA
jgi:sugar phosphate isomerase/epimerase